VDHNYQVAFGCLLLMFARIVMIFVQAPIWGSQHIKNPILVGLAASSTLLMYHAKFVVNKEPFPDFPSDARGYIPLLLMQLAVGLCIGWVSFLVMATAQFAGELLDIQMGLSAAAQADPSSHGAINMIRRLKFYIIMIMYLMTNGHLQFWNAIAYSFKICPLTGFHLSGNLLENFVDLGAEMYIIGMQMASPVVGALLVAQVSLGLMARVAPQMNVFMLSFPMNLSVGLILLTASMPYLIEVFGIRLDENLKEVIACIRMMHGP
jgi:flagellar biosynthetic protein FliR